MEKYGVDERAVMALAKRLGISLEAAREMVAKDQKNVEQGGVEHTNRKPAREVQGDD